MKFLHYYYNLIFVFNNFIVCDILNVQSLYCELGLKNDSLCPVDGGWTHWSLWSSCSGKCGYKGKRSRHRLCNNPLPSNNGGPCTGSSYQIETCQITGCTMKDYEDVVHNHPIRLEELKVVNQIHRKLPALIELCFSVDCMFSIVKKILGNNAMQYWNAMNCVKYDVGCPNPGGWNTWGSWSSCTAVCGRGKKYRIRTCDNPVPSNPRLMCNDSPLEMKSCVGLNCKKHLTGTWSDWSNWSTCSVQCGSGIQLKNRLCLKVQSAQEAFCKGPTKEISVCTISNCSINGLWSPWTVWSSCSSNCGIGTQLRNRMCNNPSPSGDGSPCSGSASEVRQCFSKPCNVKSHEVAHFLEKSSLGYSTYDRPLRLLHIYLRFLPLTPFGVLIYRHENNCHGSFCDFVKLSLQNGKVVLISQISDCTMGVIHEDKLEIGEWHVIFAVIYPSHGVLRVNNGLHKISTFSCIPRSYNLDHIMKIGELFKGQIQEIIINFTPISLRVLKGKYDTKPKAVPSSIINVQFLMGDVEEAFIFIDLTESVTVPCPKNMESWQSKYKL
nr:coadhesin-like [Nomia melanderi]